MSFAIIGIQGYQTRARTEPATPLVRSAWHVMKREFRDLCYHFCVSLWMWMIVLIGDWCWTLIMCHQFNELVMWQVTLPYVETLVKSPDPAEKSHSTPALVHPTPATRADAKDQSPWKSQLSLHQTLTKTLWTICTWARSILNETTDAPRKRGRKEGLLSSTFLFRIRWFMASFCIYLYIVSLTDIIYLW